ncbi:hypothetical protein PAXRUDRAFT_36907 [Paxillus rubicundulus Ve08.2h10]|uniref:Reverse transcriptase zinc-binding domain-containing protein n=1 Tax=Paxillus rubicundulus Ve08.2h10 TaxID=930991 RepID=A0A0D0DFN1_9AGAM|nr:hypothetical protein PAXRUDRAFT_36907 [Paxillus rubicundulus Ve08.2h10]
MLCCSFVRLTSTLQRGQSRILVWLHTKHISLNAHLHRLTNGDSPFCPHCPSTKEDVMHYLLRCPQYTRECHTLTRQLHTRVLQMPHLLNYVNSTGRLKTTFSDTRNT